MDSWGIRLAARDSGIKLRVRKDDVLTAEPARLLTPEMREAIRANREELIYDVLLSNALLYVVVERHVEGADPGAVLAAHEDEINAAYPARDWGAYRSAIRAFVRAGLREAERAKALDLPAPSPSSPRLMTEGAFA